VRSARSLVERRSNHAEKETERITALKHQAADAEEKLSRLYRAIENGLADLDDSNLKGRIAELKRIRDSARADVERDHHHGFDQRIRPDGPSAASPGGWNLPEEPHPKSRSGLKWERTRL